MSTTIPASTLEKFSTFGDLLRFLRLRAGITQLELSLEVGYSDAQISRLEQNLRLPDLPTVEARFVPALGLEDDPKAVARLLDLAANVRREDAPALGLCPYKGLSFFDEADADLFHGREALTTRLVERVLALPLTGNGRQTRFLAIVGASGSGKSSLVRAGLVPALRWDKTSASWQVYVLNPTAHPLESLAACLTQDSGSLAATAAFIDDLGREPRSLDLFMRRLLRSAGGSHILLVIDQFEELFTLCRSESERIAFIDNLFAAAETDGPGVILITLRADFYSYCAAYPALREALARQQEYIGAMTAGELQCAIEEPARRGRWEFEPGLVDLLLHEVGHEPGALPLLSHALLETWRRRRGRMMTLSGYTCSGGVRGAIAETAEAVFADQFTPEQRLIARRIFLRLTELGDETATGDTRRRATFAELVLKPEETAATQTVLQALADARLITTDKDSVEVAHEALIREWPTLRGWLEQNREGLRLHRQLTEHAQEWHALERDPGLLYRGLRLAQVREWAASHLDELNTQETDFLETSIALSEQEANERESQRQRELDAAQKLAEAERQRAEVQTQRLEEQSRSAGQLRRRSYYLATAFALALAMTFFALFLGAQARRAALTAQNEQRLAFSRELAAASVSNLEADPERSLLLSLQAISVTYTSDHTWTSEAEEALRRGLLESRLQLSLRGHTDRVWTVAFSPDGARIASASDDGTVRIWEAASGRELQTLVTGATRGRHGLAFSPDGTRLAATGALGTAAIWDLASGKALLTLSGHTDWVSTVVFSPDGLRLATASEDGTVRVWEAASGQALLTLRGHTLEVWNVAFSPDGSRLATAGEDGKVILWDSSSGTELLTLAGHSGPVHAVAFRPDGARLASTGQDRQVIIWDAVSGQEMLSLRGHTGAIWTVTFSPDGKRLATASLDGNAKVWDTLSGQELLVLKGHTGPVVGIAFSPDCDRTPDTQTELCGTRLATASWDGTARVWNASFNQELLTLFTPDASAGDLGPDGERFATGYANGEVKIWDDSDSLQAALSSGKTFAAHSRLLQTLKAHTGVVSEVAFSPDGQRLATAGEDWTVRLWDIATGAELATLRGHTGGVYAVGFSPDGTRLATASDDYTVKVWDLTAQNGRELFTLAIRTKVSSVVFSPDGARLATANWSGIVKVWDAATGQELLALKGHTDGVYDLAYSPDGKLLATASDDSTIKLWDAATGQELHTLRGHFGWINDVVFSPDGKRLASAGQDQTVRLWEVQTGQELLTLRGHTDAVLGVSFSPDSKRLQSAGADGTTRVYLLQITDLVSLARQRLTRSITNKECQQYLHLSESQCPQDPAPLVPTPAVAALTTLPDMAGKVCQVTDSAGVHDQFFNQLAYEGLKIAAGRFGWDTAVLEPQQPADYAKFISQLMNLNCDLIVLPTGAYFVDEVQIIARDNPNQKFQLMDVPLDTPLDNLWDQIYSVDQPGFLAGYLAASVSNTGKVATFGGVAFPPVLEYMNGFALGVAYYNQKNSAQVAVLGWDVEKQAGLFAGNFDSTEDGRRIAKTLLDQGADVILPVAGRLGLGAAEEIQAREQGYLIGVDTDWAVTYPEYENILLTSIMKRLDVSVISAVEDIEAGTFKGGLHDGTLENGGVSLAPYHRLDNLVTSQIKADLAQIQADIIAGKIKTSP